MIEFVAASYDLPPAALTGDCRRSVVVRPRQFAMYAIRQLCPHLSLNLIGRALGGRDHTTILHGLRKVEGQIAQGEFGDDLARLEAWFDQAYLEDRIEEAEQRLARLKAIRQTVQQVSA
ncbi:helix-turn-helix domain-containing protein [Brevundimonas diminuta]|uniref:helix-turn-helix domain-containing protein n=1 Tax=Brevundimonas diminuta TaxID=293 RepID=UPI003F7EC971